MKTIYLHMLKKWGNTTIGDIVAFGEPKGRRVIAGGFAEEVPAPKPPRKQAPVVETAMAEPKAERAVVTPVVTKEPLAKKETVEPVKVDVKEDTDKKKDKKRGK